MVAHCDVKSKRIYGCKRNSWEWYHEKGHLIFDVVNSEFLLWKGYIFNLWMFLVVCSFVWKFARILLVLIWGLLILAGLYEEKWCNDYANSKIYKLRKRRDR